MIKLNKKSERESNKNIFITLKLLKNKQKKEILISVFLIKEVVKKFFIIHPS